MLKEPLTIRIKRLFIVVAWGLLLLIVFFGIDRLLTLIPLKLLENEDRKSYISAVIITFIFIFFFTKYEKTQNKIYKLKNKDKIINPFNKHIFKNDDK
ncbi:MAG: hypothetical protein WC682_05355 [Parcubacteria group bacterium]|jgi:hypothetical protein